jgi:diketogulonate reductase-like aldo/keto reductase
MPTIAFGTGSVMKEKEDVTAFIGQALDSGFDHIDTAARLCYTLVLSSAKLIENYVKKHRLP